MDSSVISEIKDISDEEIDARLAGMSEEEVEELRQLTRYLRAPEYARTSLIDLARYLNPHPDHPQSFEYSRYDVQAHHNLIAEAFTEVMEGKCLRLIISMPPQHGKSQLAKTFVSAHIGRFPWKHLLMGTYNEKFAWECGDDVRNILLGQEYRNVYPNVSLRMGSKAKDHMVTTDGGKISFLGRGGSGAGRPSDGFLIDDLLKDAKEAESKTVRDDCWNWYTRIANARCHILTWQVIIATRWSDDDVIARLTDPKNPHYDAEVAKLWKVINVPAIMENEEMAAILGKKVGDALWPERFPVSLLDTARRMDPYGFSALYMGRPTPPEGAYYKQYHLKTYSSMRDLPDGTKRRFRAFLTGDLAVSPEANADKTCVGVWLLDENDELWLHPDLYWERKSSDESVERIIELGSIYGVECSWWEKGQLDKAVGPFLRKRHMELVQLNKQVKSTTGRQYKPKYFTIEALPVSGSKGLKSLATRGRMAQHKIHFPEFAPWWQNAKEQMLNFTGSGNDKEDDFCDCISLIGQALDDQVKASPGEDNVVQFPKVGSLGWLKRASTLERRAQVRLKALRGQ